MYIERDMILLIVLFTILGGGAVLSFTTSGCIHMYEKYQSAKEKKQCAERVKKYQEIENGKELAAKILLDKFGKDIKNLIINYI